MKLCKQILAVLAPYIVIGSLLMIYNYVRFDDPFEFGQSYQLTFVDQREFGNLLERFSLVTVINGLLENFIAYVPLEHSFPYISPQSLLLNFPICFAAAAALLQKDTLSALKKNKLTGLTGVLLFCPILITAFQVLEAPWLLERYRSDIYWLVGILIFLSFGHFLKTLSGRAERICGFIVSLLAFATIFRSFLLWTAPFDYNFTYVFPESVDKFRSALCFGF